MKEIAITAIPRTSVGKGSSRRNRRDGRIPCVIYGPDIDPISLSIDEREFRRAIKSSAGGASIFDVDVEGKKNKALLREIQRDPVTSRVIHVDFHAIAMNKPINIMVPLHFIGIPVGVKTDGGIMNTTMRELEVSCLPTDIPEHIEVNVEELGIGDSVHVRDLEVSNARILSEEQRTIVVISAPTVVKAAAAEGEGEGEEGEEGEEGAEAAEGAEAEAAEGDEKAKDGVAKEGGK
jgi:large subunit ribosomal protein L25